MAVPDTNTFTLQDVVTELGLGATASLQDCFTNAIAGGFDPNYEGSKDRLSNFRNYQHVTRVDLYKDGVNSAGVYMYSNTRDEHAYSFEADHILISRDFVNTGADTIAFRTNSFIPAGKKLYMVYDDLATTQGYVMRIELQYVSLPVTTINNPSDTTIPVLITDGLGVASPSTAIAHFSLTSFSADFSIKIRELYLDV